ncbi:arylesterase [Luminiphilus sp.]|nr:arylesterase [Luminiphilus sp.]
MIILRALAHDLRLAICVGLISLLSATSHANTSSAPGPILVIGDSISAAYGIALEQGWVALLEQKLRQEADPHPVINASISGDTSAGGLRRLPPLLQRYQPDIVIIELGGNDGLRGYPIRQLQDNITAMIRLSESAGAKVLVLPMEIPPNLGKFYIDAFRASFPQAIEGSDAVLGQFPLESIATNPSLMQADGIHPTATAQPLIVSAVWVDLKDLL